VTRGIVKQKQACRKAIHFPFKDVYCFVNLDDQIIIVKPAVSGFPCSEEEPRFSVIW
jgi:hypothetical protein